MKMPSGLSVGGRALWRAITADHELDSAQFVQLVEACRAKDRLDELDAILRDDLAARGMLTAANNTANLLKQLMAALRLPDEAGRRPQRRGARGAYEPSKPGAVSSLDRARDRAAARSS